MELKIFKQKRKRKDLKIFINYFTSSIAQKLTNIFISQWELDHSTDKKDLDDKLVDLREFKKSIDSELDKIENGNLIIKIEIEK